MYAANEKRYDRMAYRRCGKSGLLLPAVSLGLWQNFGGTRPFDNSREMLCRAFDLGITHFDLANNYGPPPGSAEECFGRVIQNELHPYRDELVISTKAGYGMWRGPYGDHGSRKYLMASLDQSLRRMKLDYVDIFYHHRPDPDTPLEETMGALCDIVRSGKALYVGVSNYNAEQTRKAAELLREMGVQLLIHQPRYSMLERGIEDGLLDTLDEYGVGSIAFCPLAQGLLTSRYLNGIPADSRVASKDGTLGDDALNEQLLDKIRKLGMLAAERSQTMAQLALSWALRGERLTSVIIGASNTAQIEENVGAVDNLDFTESELNQIDEILKDE